MCSFNRFVEAGPSRIPRRICYTTSVREPCCMETNSGFSTLQKLIPISMWGQYRPFPAASIVCTSANKLKVGIQVEGRIRCFTRRSFTVALTIQRSYGSDSVGLTRKHQSKHIYIIRTLLQLSNFRANRLFRQKWSVSVPRSVRPEQQSDQCAVCDSVQLRRNGWYCTQSPLIA